MKQWNNTCNRRAMRDMAEYRRQMQKPPAERDEKRLRAVMRRLGL